MTTLIDRRAALLAGFALTLAAAPALAQQNQVVRIGVSPGPHAEIAEPAAADRADHGGEADQADQRQRQAEHDRR